MGWISVADGLPVVGKTNGYWDTVPVVIRREDGSRVGAFFTYRGGDKMDDGLVQPAPEFTTDEGLPYFTVTHWMPMPEFP